MKGKDGIISGLTKVGAAIEDIFLAIKNCAAVSEQDKYILSMFHVGLTEEYLTNIMKGASDDWEGIIADQGDAIKAF
jgi:hypothetical protein